ncbi:MAG TPA: hypothetical protein VK619_06150 [Pyrinomonadaceae bacterium]|nr:hypothetical protein [Pyrinomonadaceae bacterium]
MSEKLETLFDAARKLPLEEQRLLAEKLLEAAKDSDSIQGDATRGATQGKLRQHFGAWDSGNVRSADNEGIDRDLAREFAGASESET